MTTLCFDKAKYCNFKHWIPNVLDAPVPCQLDVSVVIPSRLIALDRDFVFFVDDAVLRIHMHQRRRMLGQFGFAVSCE